MASIREAVHDVIEQRILPWIERDGISKLILPEQITPADCATPMKCRQACTLQHREQELAIALTGEAPYCIDNKRFILTPGRIVFLTAGTPHGSDQKTVRFVGNLDPEQPSSSLWLRVYPFGALVQVSQIREDADEMVGTYSYLLLDRHFSRLATCLLEEVWTRPPNYAGVSRPILLEFMQRCLRAPTAAAAVAELGVPTRRPSRSPRAGSRGVSSRGRPAGRRTGRPAKSASKKPPSRVQAAQEFIHSNYHIPINLDDIAEAADSSANHLGRQFKAATGMTPTQYLLNVRMEAARQLLLTDLKVSEVAPLVGIEDPSYFGLTFRRIHGVSPLQYRRRMVKKAGPPPYPTAEKPEKVR